MKKNLSTKDIAKFQKSFSSDPRNRIAMNAVTQMGPADVAQNREVISRIDHTYSHFIKTPEATNQKHSGRCWLFAGLNMLRLEAMNKMNLENFELSQSYLMFWDKLEKANYFLESIIDTFDEPLNGRLVMWLLESPVVDGGQWDMFVNLINKYGVVPKTAMAESHPSSTSYPMNSLLVAKLREYAKVLRNMHKAKQSMEKINKAKTNMMEEFYRILVINLGVPPNKFNWEWRDKDDTFHRKGEITPQEFYEEYIDRKLDDMVCLINAPTEDKPYNKMYTVQYLGNVVGGNIVRYLNVDIKTLKKAAMEMIKDEKAVWFGSDVSKAMERKLGLLDVDAFAYDLLLDTKFDLDKAERLDYGQSKMNHAMVLTAVDIDENDNPVKWRVENSWGTKTGDKGYYLMSDKWFDEYVYEVAVDKKYLGDKLNKIIDTKPINLPPWDPMGALASI